MNDIAYYTICTVGSIIFFGISIAVIFDKNHTIRESKTPSIRLLEQQQSNVLSFNKTKNTISYDDNVILRIKCGSMNHRFLSYLFEKNNQDIPIDVLYKDAKLPKDTYINKLIANTKLPKEVRDKAFVIQNKTIRFVTSLN